jgi:hypothetical protein
MRELLLLAGTGALLALGTPAAADAKPNKGKAAKVHMNSGGQIDMNRNGIADWRERRLIDANGNGILDWRESRVDINRNGIPDWNERWIDRNRNRIDDRQEAMMNRWGGAVCPPGLAKKVPPCVPPGQVNRSWREGQRLPVNYRWYTPWGDISGDWRTRYDLDDDYRYIVHERYIYEVDPATRVVRRIIDLLL